MKRLLLGATGCAAMVGLAFLLGARGPRGSGLKVIVIGLDGANTGVISPLLEQGRMPNLQAFLARAGGGHLDSPVDKWESAALWTSIVTGLRPECHGVLDFVLPAEDQYGPRTFPHPKFPDDTTKRIPELIFAQSGHRKAKALWDLTTEQGRTSAILGLWATWPAESIEGIIATELLTFSRIRESKEFKVGKARIPIQNEQTWGLSSPERLSGKFARLVRQPNELEPDLLRRFADFTPEEVDRILRGQFVGSMNTGTDRFQELKNQIQSDRSYVDIARFAEEAASPDLLFLYLEGIDVIEHQFFGHYKGVDVIPEPERSRFRGVLERYHEFTDELIAPWLARAAEDTVVLVVSDHGFALVDDAAKLADDDPKKTGWHDRYAILFAAGGPIRAGARVENGTLYDVAPTILALLGLPVARDLEGRVLEELIDPAYFERYPLRRVATYGPRVRDRLPTAASDLEDEMIKKLIQQGYLGGVGEASPSVRVREVPPKSSPDCRRCHDD